MVEVVEVEHLEVDAGDACVGDPTHRLPRLRDGARHAVAAQIVGLAADGFGSAGDLSVVGTHTDHLGGGEHHCRRVAPGVLACLHTRCRAVASLSMGMKGWLNSAAKRAAKRGVRLGPTPPMMIGGGVCTGLGSPGESLTW